MKYYIYQNAYWENPDDIVPEGAIEVPKRPDYCCEWNGEEWVKGAALSREWMKTLAERELARVQKFMLLSAEDVQNLRAILDPYIAAIREAVANPPMDDALPPIPQELTDDAFYA
jgi:hypothetical protein